MKPALYIFKIIVVTSLTLLITNFSTNAQCAQPVDLTVEQTSATSNKVTWKPTTNAIRYEYAYTTDTIPPTSGTSTTSSFVLMQGLPADTKYCIHVRAVCATGASAWVTKCSTTTCDGLTVQGVLVDHITSSTALGKWSPFQPAANYEMTVTESATPPLSSGTPTTSTMIGLQGLNPNTYYCLHVRAYCPVSATFTDWESYCFNTLPQANNIAGIDNKNAVAIYPNPARGILNINIEGLDKAHNLVIRDITGRTLQQANLQHEQTEINISSLSAGIYFVSISGEAVNIVQRIVKE